MVTEIFLLEFVLVGCFIIISHSAFVSRQQEKRMLQFWLDKVMRDAEQHRERVGNQRQWKLYDSDRGRELDEWFAKRRDTQ